MHEALSDAHHGIIEFHFPPASGMSHTPQLHSITALWPVLTYHPTEARKLTWRGCLVVYWLWYWFYGKWCLCRRLRCPGSVGLQRGGAVPRWGELGAVGLQQSAESHNDRRQPRCRQVWPHAARALGDQVAEHWSGGISLPAARCRMYVVRQSTCRDAAVFEAVIYDVVGIISNTFRVPTGLEVFKNGTNFFRPWEVIRLAGGPEKVSKRCWFYVAVVVKNKFGQHVSCNAVIARLCVNECTTACSAICFSRVLISSEYKSRRSISMVQSNHILVLLS